MFSRRAGWSLDQNDYSRLLEAKRKIGAHILDLTESNPTRAGIHYPTELMASLADPRALVYEPTPWGLPAAREVVAAQHNVPVDRVMLTASTSESYSYLFKLLCNPGDCVLVPRPSYPLFEFLARMENVEIAQYSLRYGDTEWAIDFDSVRAAITRRTRAILLVNPNNPTGSYVRPTEIAELAALGLPVISDEVFHCYPLGATRETDWGPVAQRTLVFQLNGLSKMAGLPQMKAGWMIISGPEKHRLEASQRLEMIADTFLSVSTPIQHALGALLSHGSSIRAAIQQRTRENLEWLQAALPPLEVEGGWYAIARIEDRFDEQDLILTLLAEDDVLVQPGFFYDFEEEGYLVLSLLSRPEEFREGVQRILRRFRDERRR